MSHLLVLLFTSLPLKNLLIFFPSIIIKLDIALIKVSIVLNVKARAKIKIETIIKKLLILQSHGQVSLAYLFLKYFKLIVST